MCINACAATATPQTPLSLLQKISFGDPNWFLFTLAFARPRRTSEAEVGCNRGPWVQSAQTLRMRSGKKTKTFQTCELFLVAEEHHFQRGESGEGMEGGGGGEVSRWGGEGSKK